MRVPNEGPATGDGNLVRDDTTGPPAPRTLPSGWQWVQLKEVCEQQTGVRDPRAESSKSFMYVDITSVDNRTKRIVSPNRILGADAPSRARQIIRESDVLVSTTRPNLNAVAMVPPHLDDQICSTGFCVLRATEAIDPAYLFAYVQSEAFVRPLSESVKGALYPAVTDQQVRSQWVPLPPIGEQRRIAEILNFQMAQVERARVVAETRLETAGVLPIAYLRDAFDSPESRGWPTEPIGDFAETCSGTTPDRGRSDYYAGTIPWVKTGELRDSVITETQECISELALRECSLRLLPVGTLLIAMYGQGQTRGRTALLGVPATTNQACFAILPNPAVFDTSFLHLWFRHSYDRLRKETEGRGGNQPNLNGALLRRQEVPLPPLDVQKRYAAAISEQLESARQLSTHLESEMAAINALPAALLRRAFAGEL